MKLLPLVALALSASAVYAQTPGSDDFFHQSPDSLQHEGVPHGEVRGPFQLPSKIFADNVHDYWVYVPAQYDPANPAALMVFQDGHAYLDPEGDVRTTNVLDNLIHRREIPVMLAVFINPARRPDEAQASKNEWGDRGSRRPDEYNSLDDRYARVLADELLPALREAGYNISDDPDDRGLAGCSSGGIVAFTAAWQRPDQFRKVLSFCGSFTDIRGGHVYPELIRESEPKPLRVFLQDGRNDNRGPRRNGQYDPNRDWFLQNVRLKDALEEKDYDVNYSWSIGTHGLRSGGPMLPEMLRWLWRDQPVSTDVNDKVERAFNEPDGT